MGRSRFLAFKAVRRWCAGVGGPGACGHPPSPAFNMTNSKQLLGATARQAASLRSLAAGR